MPPGSASSRRATSTRPWLTVVVSACGLVVGQGPVNVFAAGVFIKPIADSLHLGRGTVSTAIAVSSVLTAIAAPLFGRALDQRGVRRPLLTSIALFGLTTAALGLVSSLTGLFVLYALSGLVGVGQNPTAYSKVLAAYFDRRRGLALGLALAGVGLGTALMPALSARLIGAVGWRATYPCLAAVILVLAFLPVLFWLPEPARTNSRSAEGLPGVSFAEAVRSRPTGRSPLPSSSRQWR
jgi:MFS family permease